MADQRGTRMTGVGKPQTIPSIVKVAKLESSLDMGGAVPDLETGNITFDKDSNEVVLIFGADLILQNLNGLGTGSEVDVLVSRDADAAALDFDDEDVIFAWHGTKSFVTDGMEIIFPNLIKNFSQPIITSRPSLRVVANNGVAIWTTGLLNVYIYYTTRVLDSEARRILIGGD